MNDHIIDESHVHHFIRFIQNQCMNTICFNVRLFKWSMTRPGVPTTIWSSFKAFNLSIDWHTTKYRYNFVHFDHG